MGARMLPAPLSTGFMILCCKRNTVRDTATRLLTELALRGATLVLDGGNCVQAYPLARALRQRTTKLNSISRRVLIQRAFTAYQMLALLEDTPAAPMPCVILEPLATFYDETLSSEQARLLLQRCLQQLERLSKSAPLFVLLSEAPSPQRRFLQAMLCQRADVWLLEPESPPSIRQLGLF